MSYSIEIAPVAQREWKKLDQLIKRQFVKKLEKLCDGPRIPGAKLTGHANAYRIKLRGAGYRLIYMVREERLIIIIVAVAKRDSSKDDVYHLATTRLAHFHD
jgi:mRNA interferase RelE/StbE